MAIVRTLVLVVTALAVTAAGPSVMATAAAVRQDPPPTFTSAADLVVLHVNVRARNGGFIPHLPVEAFAVLEDGRPQPVEVFFEHDTPVTVGLVIDNSISMRPNRELVIAAATEFARAGNPRDARFALAFNEQVMPALPPHRPFTDDVETLETALGRAVTARGRTAFFDAVVAGLEYADRGEHPRKVLVVIGDGGDNESTATYEQMMRRAQTANVVIYAVALVDPLDEEARPSRMAALAEATGGVMFTPRNRQDVARVLQRIADDIRHTYTLAYSSTRPADDTFRRVRVIVSPSSKERVTVRSRTGYFAATTGRTGPAHVDTR